jgi:protein ImuB
MHQASLPIDRRRGRAAWVAPVKGAADASVPPLAVFALERGAMRLTAVDAVAARRGLSVGLGLADARAMVPELVVVEAEPALDAALLEAIAVWCDRYTPLVGLDAPDGLFLDIAGAAHLMGDEAGLIDDLLRRLTDQGFTARAAIAPTAGAAFALARFGSADRMILTERAQIADALAPLPVAALRLEPAVVAGLERVGLKTIGDVVVRPRAPLVARFGAGLGRRLDQALGHLDEPISPRRPAPRLMAERRFAEPIGADVDIAATVFSLAEGLAEALERRAQGARLFELSLYRVDGAVQAVTVGASRPLRDPAMVVRLFVEKLGRFADPDAVGYGYDMVRLAVMATGADDPSQIDLAGSRAGEIELDRLIDQWGARLGVARVGRLLPGDAHVPEQASVCVPAQAVKAQAVAAWAGEARPAAEEPAERPLILLDPPEPAEALAELPEGPPIRFRWRRALYDVVKVEGPERLALPWWTRPPDDHGFDPAPPPASSLPAAWPLGLPGAPEPGRAARASFTRDYFRAEDRSGRRFWLYREGLLAAETGRPRWFVHGLFA